MGLNRIVLLGVIAQDPEARYNASGQVTTSFTLALERAASDGRVETDYVRVVTRRTLAERCAEQLHRGDLVTVEGRLYASTYETRDGHHRKSVEVEALQVEVVNVAQAQVPGRAAAPGGEDAPF